MQFQRTRGRTTEWLNRIGRFFSEFSFTLYVLHIPLIAVLLQLAAPIYGAGKLHPNQPLDMLVYLALYLVLVAGAYLFHLPFEAKTYHVREWLKTVLYARGRSVRA